MSAEYIEIKEACEVLHLSMAGVRKLVANNRITYYKPFKKILFKIKRRYCSV